MYFFDFVCSNVRSKLGWESTHVLLLLIFRFVNVLEFWSIFNFFFTFRLSNFAYLSEVGIHLSSFFHLSHFQFFLHYSHTCCFIIVFTKFKSNEKLFIPVFMESSFDTEFKRF